MVYKYVGVFLDRKILKKNALIDFVDIPYIEHVFKIDLHHEFTTPSGYVCKYYLYTPVNLDGTKKIIKAGNFEIIDIGHEEGDRNFTGRNIYISENNGRNIHIYRSKDHYNFIENELMPLIEILSYSGKWEIFTDILKLKDLEKDNVILQDNIKKLKSRITELELEISRLNTPSK